MTEAEIIELVRGGEGINVEFKRSATAITKDVYDTVCAFSNRDGGVILLGVSDDGTITDVAPEAIDHMKADFVTAINNAEKFYPPLYLQPQTFEVAGHVLLVIQIPPSTQVCRHRGRIFDRR